MQENINEQDYNGDTALHIVCRFFHFGQFDAKNGRLDKWNNASMIFFSPAISLLLHGADPNIKNKKGETPLDYVPDLLSHLLKK